MGGKSARFANQALKIRIAKAGCTNRPFYEIVVAKAYRARDTKPLDRIGSYDPLPNDYNEKLVNINFEKLHHWIRQGATPTRPIEILLGLCGFFPIHPMTEINARRNRLRAEAAEREAAEVSESESDVEPASEGTAV